MKRKEILKIKNLKELEEKLISMREDLRRFRFAVSQGKAKDSKAGRELRRNIARILTKTRQLSDA